MNEVFLFTDGIVFISAKFLIFLFLVLLALGAFMRGLESILNVFNENMKEVSFASSFLSTTIDTAMFPIYVFLDVIGDIIYMWSR